MLSACAPGMDSALNPQGAGTSLYTEATVRNTANLSRYFENLCEQAAFQTRYCAPIPEKFAPRIWKILVETGYNDIDQRCDDYLNWIENKRQERIFASNTSTAINTLVSGALGVASASTAAISYTALSLGFTETLFDAYYSRILLGLEASTIKEIVNKRRFAHRHEFSKRDYLDRPQVVFALRQYLTICTPQSIVSDVNIYSRDAANGRDNSAQNEARIAAAVAPTSDNPAAPPERNEEALSLTGKVPLIFEGLGFTLDDVELVQKGSCIKVDADVGSATIVAVRIIEQTIGKKSDQNGKLNSKEWDVVEQNLSRGCQPGMQNYYENLAFGLTGDNLGTNFVIHLRRKKLLDSSVQGATLADIRDALPSVRQKLQDQNLLEDPLSNGAGLSKQVTLSLHKAVVSD